MGARELRHGMPKIAMRTAVSRDAIRALPVALVFDYLAVRLNGPKAEGKRLAINWIFTDTGERYALNLEHSALTHLAGHQAPATDATLTLDRAAFDALTSGQALAELLAAGQVACTGNPSAFPELMALLDDFPRMFPLIEPLRG